MTSSSGDVTGLLVEWANGNEQALDRLIPLVYKELRWLAAGCLRRERPDHTLQPTALVHEAYLRLVDQRNPSWQNRSHFFRVAAHLMREILVDYARRRNAGKRAGQFVSLEQAVNLPVKRSADLVALDGALKSLLFRRLVSRRDRPCPGGICCHGPSRLEDGGGVASQRNAQRVGAA